MTCYDDKSTSIKYIAECSHVHDVSILGTADLPFWKHRLEAVNLVPAEREGKAEVLIIAASMKYMRIPFTEVSFSVRVSGEDTFYRNAVFLSHAFNSSRMFAFCERTLFVTPYYYARCRVSVSFPVLVEAVDRGETVFAPEMQGTDAELERQPLRSEEEYWEGPIFLPPGGGRNNRQGKFFFGRLTGFYRSYSFNQPKDTLTIRPRQHEGTLQALVDSHFVPKEWKVCDDATHSRSTSYKRPDATLASVSRI